MATHTKRWSSFYWRRYLSWRCYLVLLLGGLVCFFVLDCSLQRNQTLGVSCADLTSINFISQLCHNYSLGLVSGSMCQPLCVTNDIKFIKCLGHSENDLVMLASRKRREGEERERRREGEERWREGGGEGGRKREGEGGGGGGGGRRRREDYIILKADNLRQTFRFHFGDTGVNDQLLSSPYHHNTTQTKQLMTNIFNVSRPIADWIISQCDRGHDGKLTNREAAYCWHMVDKDEILLGLTFERYNIAPRLFGVCGNLFVTEYVPTLPLSLPLFYDRRGWEFRVRLALGLIELAERIDAIPNGNLLLCDAQESNFGVIQIEDRYVVMSIDNDLSIFERSLTKSLKFELNNSCSSNFDCNFINCVIGCDEKRGKCSGIIESNNLQLICQRFFVARSKLISYPLLHDPPRYILKELTTLLHECVHPLVPSTRISKRLTRNLKKVLRRTLKNRIE